MARTTLPVLVVSGALAGLSALPARAELPPWVYGEQQRQASVVVEMAVGNRSILAEDLVLRCRLLKVIRQPATGQLRAGQAVVVRYPLPPGGSPGVVGPAPVPQLHPGDKVTAWLKPLSGAIGTFAPAAGGRSFGPSMEQMREPTAPTP